MTPVGLVPLTELDAINEILATGSEAPINTLEENIVIDAALAKNTLRATMVEVQTRGWNYNSEDNLEITPDQNGFIILPRNFLRVDTAGASAGTNGVQRGNRLYNRTDHTYIWPGPVTVDAVVGLSFEELPSTARMYITIRSARKYQDRYFGDATTHSFTQEDELDALVAMKDEDLQSRDPNMLNDSTFIQDLRRRT